MAARIGLTFCTATPFSIVGWLCSVVTLNHHASGSCLLWVHGTEMLLNLSVRSTPVRATIISTVLYI